jgi:hypothetical protein
MVKTRWSRGGGPFYVTKMKRKRPGHPAITCETEPEPTDCKGGGGRGQDAFH